MKNDRPSDFHDADTDINSMLSDELRAEIRRQNQANWIRIRLQALGNFFRECAIKFRE